MEYRLEVYRIVQAQNVNTDEIVDGDIAYDETSGNFGDIEHLFVTVQRQDEYKSLDTFTTSETHYYFPHETSKEDELAGLIFQYRLEHRFTKIDDEDVFTYAGHSLTFKEIMISLTSSIGGE
jgi:hypothetical protein